MAEIQSPLPGVFYRRPGPDKDPYVREGEHIEAGRVIGMVEIMKQFTEVHTDSAGVLERFAVDDAAMVNPGDLLAVVAED